MYQQNVLIGYVSYLQIGKEYYVTFCKNKQIKIKEICSVWCNCVTTRVVCIHNYYYNIQGLCTHVHVCNFSMHKTEASTACTKTYFYILKKSACKSSPFQAWLHTTTKTVSCTYMTQYFLTISSLLF